MYKQQIEDELHRLAESQLHELRNAVVKRDMERAIEATDDVILRVRQLAAQSNGQDRLRF